MVTSVDESRHFIEEVVSALTARSEGEAPGVYDIKNQFERAAVEFDARTARAFGKSLVDALCDDPSNVRLLEALLILGLAHPNEVKRYGVSLSQEGRRLAVLLEQAGEQERARSLLDLLVNTLPGDRSIEMELGRHLRRNGGTDELIERCLSQAEALVAQGRSNDAIPWLQEILLHDRNRRDVARMIRDLRYQELEQQLRWRRRRFVALMLLLFSAGGAGLYVREAGLHRQYAALPAAVEGDLASHASRLARVEELTSSAHVWAGMFRADAEMSELRQSIDRLSALEAQRVRDEREAQVQRQIAADAARDEGLAAVGRGDLDAALTSFNQALELGDSDWEHRPRLVADVQAIEAWLERPQR